MTHTSADFFDPIVQTKYIGSENYRKIENYLEALQAISKLCDLSYYIVDYYKKCFYYVSQNPLFLCGYEQEEVLKLGFDFYPLCVPSDDLKLLFELNEAGFNFFYKLDIERRENAVIAYDFRLKHKTNKSLIMINHKLTPLLLTKEGNIWMAICLVTLSTSKVSGNVHIVMQDDHKRYDFNEKDKEFKLSKNVGLSNREKEVLNYIAYGDNMQMISEKLGISESTIKNHKTKIFEKLHANNAVEAVFFASKQNII